MHYLVFTYFVSTEHNFTLVCVVAKCLSFLVEFSKLFFINLYVCQLKKKGCGFESSSSQNFFQVAFSTA